MGRKLRVRLYIPVHAVASPGEDQTPFMCQSLDFIPELHALTSPGVQVGTRRQVMLRHRSFRGADDTADPRPQRIRLHPIGGIETVIVRCVQASPPRTPPSLIVGEESGCQLRRVQQRYSHRNHDLGCGT